MLEEILKEIEEMEYPVQAISCGLENECITDRYAAAAYGFTEARERIAEIVRGHMEDDEWIPCGERMPEEPEDGLVDLYSLDKYIVMIQGADIPTTMGYAGNGEWYDLMTEEFYPVIAWQPLPKPYRPKQKAVGEDYKQQIMGRFLKQE